MEPRQDSSTFIKHFRCVNPKKADFLRAVDEALAYLSQYRSSPDWDGALGHRTPLFVERLGFEQTGYHCAPFMARGGGDPGGRFWSLTFPLSGPALVAQGAINRHDFDHVLACLEDPAFRFIAGVLFGAWARRA